MKTIEVPYAERVEEMKADGIPGEGLRALWSLLIFESVARSWCRDRRMTEYFPDLCEKVLDKSESMPYSVLTGGE